MAGAEQITVEVAYAKPEEQLIISLEVPRGATCREAIEQSGILDHFHEIDLEKAKVGIFGKLKKLDEPLRPGDRVEIYRPLIADPKEVRRQRAAQGKAMKKGGGRASGQ
ncbi:MAG: RnfH family protein [Gammaproteobacteria bacterium]|jgi:putative ubiquitin-RnfH superfamily antitoxin RatB of RatAB toxin-antitoxin module